MFAALSIADHDLCERLLEATFPPLPSTDTEFTTETGATGLPHELALVIGEQIKRKTVETVEACKAMLLREPVERFKTFWGTVRATLCSFLLSRVTYSKLPQWRTNQ